jgi:hypothetical protein
MGEEAAIGASLHRGPRLDPIAEAATGAFRPVPLDFFPEPKPASALESSGFLGDNPRTSPRRSPHT